MQEQDITSWSLDQIRDLQRNMINSKDITQYLNPIKAQGLNAQSSVYHELLITAVLANPNLIQSLDFNYLLKGKIFPLLIQQTKSRNLSKAFYLKDPIKFCRASRLANELSDHIKKDNLKFIQQEYPNYRNSRIVFVQDAHFPNGINLTILEASAYFGAMSIFKYFKAVTNKIYNTFYLTILGNQIDIGNYLIMENEVNLNYFVHLIGCAVKYHHNSFIQMIQERVKEDQKIAVKKRVFHKAILYMNFEYINEQYCEGIFIKDKKSYIKNSEILKLMEKMKGIKWDLLKKYFYPDIQYYSNIIQKCEVNELLELLADERHKSNLSLNEYITLYPIKSKIRAKYFQKAALEKNFMELYRLAVVFGNHTFFVKELKDDKDSWFSDFVYETPLSLLLQNGSKECIKLFKKLLKNPRINPNTSFQTLDRDEYGQYNTLLTYCIRFKKYEYISLLMKNPQINGNCPEILVEMAWHNGSLAITKKKPLAIAIESGDQQMIEFLVQSCGIKLTKKIYAKEYENYDNGDGYIYTYKKVIKKYAKNVFELTYV